MNEEARQRYNARKNEAGKAKYQRRRNEAVEYLGGCCVDCGSTFMLEFDHKNQSEKEYNISKLFASASKQRLYAEVDKCELRCVACHAFVTACQKLQDVDVLNFGGLMRKVDGHV
jgi:5-methylcytosine-specific restriction endonuclease McrA